MSAMWIKCLLVTTIITGSVVTSSTPKKCRNNCPCEWFIAEFVALADIVVPVDLLDPIIDTNFTFFRDIMHFSDEEIEKATEDAITFFDMKFGVDFSQTSPNQLGQYINGAATLTPFIMSSEFEYSVTFNQWIINGKFKNKCYEMRDGGFMVTFSEEQTLFGSYGREEGKPIAPGAFVVYGFYSIPVSEQQPIVIQYNSDTPFRFEPVDGFAVINCELHHGFLGEGVAQGVLRAVPTGHSDLVHVTTRNLFTFPGHPGLL